CDLKTFERSSFPFRSYTLRDTWMSKPCSPVPLTTFTEPRGAVGSTAKFIPGDVHLVCGPVCETTRRPSGVPYTVNVSVWSVYDALIRSPCSRSFLNSKSGPPH